MPHSFKLSRRIARLRAPMSAALIVAFLGCDSTETLDPESSIPAAADLPLDEDAAAEDAAAEDAAEVELAAMDEPQLASASFAGGIPFGWTSQPLSQFNGRYNGAKRTIAPSFIMRELQTIKSRGGRVVIMLAGSSRNYRDRQGHFSLAMWKERVNRFKGKNLSPYINDGTIIGHYLLDEPSDRRNWGGRTVSPSTVEEMAKYSKQLWPGMATIVRAEPDYFDHNHRYLDATSAAYLWRKGNVHEYLRRNVSEAQRRGLALIVGLNVIDGGNPKRTPMTPREIEAWGSAMMESSYPCAFIMWQYRSEFVNNPGVGNAMDALRRRAQNRPSRSCRGGR